MRAVTASVGPVHSALSWQRPSPADDRPADAHFGGEGFGGGTDAMVFDRTGNMARPERALPRNQTSAKPVVVNLSQCATGHRAPQALLSLRMATLRI